MKPSLFAAALLLTIPLAAQRPKDADEALRRFEAVKEQPERNRHRAVRDLGRFPEEPVTRALLAELARADSDSYLRTVVRAIGYRPRDGVVAPLRTQLTRTDNARMAEAIAEALGRQGDDGIDALAAALGAARGDKVRRKAICYALAKVERHDGARDALLADLERHGGRDRLEPLRGLAARKDDADVDAVRVQLCGDKSVVVAGTALEQLAVHGHPKAPELAAGLFGRLDKARGADLFAAVLHGLLRQPMLDPAKLWLAAALADDPFAKERLDAWQRALATDEFLTATDKHAIRHKQPEVRRVAADALAVGSDAVPARARMLRTLLVDRDPAVVGAAAYALAAIGGDDAQGALHDRLAKAKPDAQALLIGALQQLLGSNDEGWRQRLAELAGKAKGTARAAALRALSAHDPLDPATVELAATALADRDWHVRAAAIELLLASRSKDAVPLLIERVDDETARLREDLIAALADLTGARFGSTSEWQRWWQQHGDSFRVRERPRERRGDRKDRERTGASYWDLPVYSDRVTFVIDVSGSMAQPFGTGKQTRLDEVRRQLLRVLELMPKKAKVNIVTFADRADRWYAKLQPTGKKLTKKARARVDALEAKGFTNVHDGLLQAFEDDDIDSIYLLTDGRPSVGRVVEAKALARAIARLNLGRGVRIHTIAIGQPSDFLEQLARESGGEHTVSR